MFLGLCGAGKDPSGQRIFIPLQPQQHPANHLPTSSEISFGASREICSFAAYEMLAGPSHDGLITESLHARVFSHMYIMRELPGVGGREPLSHLFRRPRVSLTIGLKVPHWRTSRCL